MTALLDNPIIQSAVLPFITAVILAIGLGAIAGRWRGLAAFGSFYLAAVLVSGMQLLPLTSTRKILLLGFMALATALVFSWRNIQGRHRYIVVVIFAIAAMVWMEWPVLLRYQGMQWWTVAGAGLVYMCWVAIVHDSLRRQPAEQLLALTLFAAATAIAATLGATALIGQLAGAAAAACGGLLLVTLLSGKDRDDDMLLLPLILMIGLLGIAAVVYARLPWQSLVALMVIPLVPRLPLTMTNIWIKIIVQAVLMLPFAAAAAYIAWGSAGDSYY